MINDANSERDTITGLRAPTNFGRPNWDAVFKSIRKIHAPAEAGVFFCGPKQLGNLLHVKCNMYSQPGFNFIWGKENFWDTYLLYSCGREGGRLWVIIWSR